MLQYIITFVLIPSIFFTKIIFASFCGKSGVPYSLEILSNGAPVLGCAQPSCLISDLDENGEFQEDSQFLTDANGQSDGFFREGDRSVKRYRFLSGPKIVANCSGQFNELSCPRRNQWVGGIEYIDHPRQPLVLQCCTFEGLRFSQEVGSTSIGPGEAITGGEVVRGGRQISFDVIANVRKIVKHPEGPDGSKISYEVTVRRMNCLPDPPENEVEFDLDVASEVSKVLAVAGNKEIIDKSKENKKQQLNPSKFKSEKQKQKIEKFSEISGSDVSASASVNSAVHPRIMPPSSRNLQQFINPTNIEAGGIPLQQQENFQDLQKQLQPQQVFVEQPGVQQQQVVPPQQGFASQQQQQQFQQQPNQQFPGQTASQFAQGIQRGEQQQVFQEQQPQQFLPQQQQLPQQQLPQQQQQNGGGGSFASQVPSDTIVQLDASSTPHPLFGLMSLPTHTFPTLPPHTFPPMFEHSFPTLPTHTFPTHTFPTLPPHTFPPHSFPTIPPMFGITSSPPPSPSIGDLSGGRPHSAIAFAAPTFSAGPASSSAGRTIFGQQQQNSEASQPHYNPHSPMRQDKSGLPTGHHSPPRMAPAMGTILAAMQGDRYPIMHPVLGLIGYSNAPQPGQQMGGKK